MSDATPLGRRDYRWMHAIRKCMWDATMIYPQHFFEVKHDVALLSHPGYYRLANYIWTGRG